jgi:hypothetical protein
MAGKAKIVRGALEALTDVLKSEDVAPVDESKRAFVKGAGAIGALTAIKAWPKFSDELIPFAKKAVKAIPELPTNIFDLPSMRSVYEGFANTHWRENLDLYDSDELANIARESLDDLGKSFEDFGVKENQHRQLLMNDKFLDETGIGYDFASQDGIEIETLLRDDSKNILRWLNNEIPLDEVTETSGGAGFDVLTELMTKYQLSKPQIKSYLQKNNVFEKSEF